MCPGKYFRIALRYNYSTMSLGDGGNAVLHGYPFIGWLTLFSISASQIHF